jgi:hypothetical protein
MAALRPTCGAGRIGLLYTLFCMVERNGVVAVR